MGGYFAFSGSTVHSVWCQAWSHLGISTNCLEIGILYGADGGVTETRSDHNRVQGSMDNFKYSGNVFFGAGWSFHKDYTPEKCVKNKEKKGEGDSNHGPHLIPRTPSITIARRSTHVFPSFGSHLEQNYKSSDQKI